MRLALRFIGLALCVLPPTVATIEYFPLWLGEGESRLSALALLLLLLAAVPLLRVFKKHFRSPSAFLIWFLIWAALSVLRPIAAAVETIALISFPTSALGALFFRLAGRQEKT
jgi:tryptophan-rich sensory protein